MSNESKTDGNDVVVRHWTEDLAQQAIELFGDHQVISSGWSPSGVYHVGNFREGATCHAFYSYLKDEGKNVEFVFVIDDVDPLDKVPSVLKKYKGSLKPYLGHPLYQIPDFTKETQSYADHFIQGLYETKDLFDFTVTFVRASELYKQGKYDSYMRLYFENREAIQELMERISGNRLEDFLMVQCEQCGSISNPKVTTINPETGDIEYKCIDRSYRKGCGHEGKTNLKDITWKLKWRLDWPSRQDFLGVTIEPAGKDHSVAGGSIDTTTAIHKEIFKKTPPLMVRYGFLTFGGKKLSGSSGLGVPAAEAGKMMPPSSYLYLIYKNDLMKDFSFNPTSTDIAKIVDEYDDSRRMLLNLISHDNDRAQQKQKLAVKLAIKQKYKNTPPPNVKYLDLATVYQVTLKNKEKTIKRLQDRGVINKKPSALETEELNERVNQVDYWLEKYAPDMVKFKVNTEIKPENLENVNKAYLEILVTHLKKLEEPSTEQLVEALQNAMKESQAKPKAFYASLYRVLINKTSGPKITSIIEAIGLQESINLFETAIQML